MRMRNLIALVGIVGVLGSAMVGASDVQVRCGGQQYGLDFGGDPIQVTPEEGSDCYDGKGYVTVLGPFSPTWSAICNGQKIANISGSGGFQVPCGTAFTISVTSP